MGFCYRADLSNLKTKTLKAPKTVAKTPTKAATAVKAAPKKAVKVAKKTEARASKQGLEFATGQIWQMENSDVHIGLIGKTLVHYKHFKGGVQRSPVSLAGKVVLEKYLIDNKAVLVKG
jgi:hypothetical protein